MSDNKAHDAMATAMAMLTSAQAHRSEELDNEAFAQDTMSLMRGLTTTERFMVALCLADVGNLLLTELARYRGMEPPELLREMARRVALLED